MEQVSGPAVIVSNERNAQTEINLEDVVCRRVPVFAAYRESGRRTLGPPSTAYRVRTFSYGLHYDDIGAMPTMKDVFETAALASVPPAVRSDLPALPPLETWANLRALGARGDGSSDDTEAIRAAIATHRTLYIPSGHYVVSDTIVLKPDTVLVGLHPSTTQLVLKDATPTFQGVGPPKALLEAPRGGTNIVDRSGPLHQRNQPAGRCGEMDGRRELDDERRALPGRPRHQPARRHAGEPLQQHPYGGSRLARRWDGQYPSLWVTDGGGGTFFDIWTPSTFAQAGLLVSDTSTAGRVYELSSEHHVRNEVQLHHVSNWAIYALQTEEERGEGGDALPLEIVDSSNVTVANLHMYRVISMFQPFPWAVKVAGSRDIRFRNVHCYSNSKVSFDSTVYDETHDVQVRQRELAWLDLSGRAPAPRAESASAVLEPGARVEKLAGGFYDISGGAVGPSGDFFFVDARRQRICRWSAAERRLSTVRDNPLDPVNLAFDKAGDLMVVSYAGDGTVYTFKPDSPEGDVTLLRRSPSRRAPAWSPCCRRAIGA